MSLCTIRFQVTCETKFGEVVYICGNTPELGNWTPDNAMRLYTDSALYPKWDPYKSIIIRQGNKLLFKLCIVDQNKQTRWQTIPHNRQIIATQNLLIQFTAHYEQITLTPIVQQIVKPPRKKTCDILNQLQSDGSSSKQYWKQFMSQEEEQSILYITLLTQMRRIIEYGTEFHPLHSYNSHNTFLQPPLNSQHFDPVIKHKIQRTTEITTKTSQLYCIVNRTDVDKNKKDELVSVLGQQSYIVEYKTMLDNYAIHYNNVPVFFHIEQLPLGDQAQSDNSPTPVSQVSISSYNKHLLSLFEQLSKNINAENKLLSQKQDKLQYYLSVRLHKEINKHTLQLLVKKRVSMVLVDSVTVLERLLQLAGELGLKYYSLTDDQLVLEMNYIAKMAVHLVDRQTIPWLNSSTSSSHPQNTTQSPTTTTISNKKTQYQLIDNYFTFIKKSLLSLSTKSYLHIGKSHFLQSIKEDDLFQSLPYHKKNLLLINADSLDSLSPKILTEIIALSSKPNFEIIILLNKISTDIKSKFPVSKTNKLAIIGKNGLLYANQNTLVDTLSNLGLQKSKFLSSIMKITNNNIIGVESKTTPSLSSLECLITLKPTPIGQLGLSSIQNKIKQHNENSSHYKLTIQPSFNNPHQHMIQPYILTEQFYLRSVFENISKHVYDQRALIISVNFKNDNPYIHKLCQLYQKTFKTKNNIRLRNLQIIPSNETDYSFVAGQQILNKQSLEACLQFIAEHFLASSGIKSYNLNMLSPQQQKYRRSFADKLKQKHFQYSHQNL